MKKVIVFGFIKYLQGQPALKGKLKWLAFLGVSGFFVLCGLLVWAGISAISFSASTAQQMAGSLKLGEQMDHLETEGSVLFKEVTHSPCWETLRNWAAQPSWPDPAILMDIERLKEICLRQKPPLCRGDYCAKPTVVI